MDREGGNLSSKLPVVLANMNSKKEILIPRCAPFGENSDDETQKRPWCRVLKLEKWTPSTGFQTRVQIIGGSMLVISWMGGVWNSVDLGYERAIHHARDALDEVGMLAVNDDCDLFHRYCRVWNTLADKLTHWARETGTFWGSYEGRPAAIIIFFDGGVDGVGTGDNNHTFHAGAGWNDCFRATRLDSLTTSRGANTGFATTPVWTDSNRASACQTDLGGSTAMGGRSTDSADFTQDKNEPVENISTVLMKSAFLHIATGKDANVTLFMTDDTK